MRFLRLVSFVFLTMGIFLLALFVYSCYQTATIISAGRVAFAATAYAFGIKALLLGFGFILIGGALTYLASRREKLAAKASVTVEEKACCCEKAPVE